MFFSVFSSGKITISEALKLTQFKDSGGSSIESASNWPSALICGLNVNEVTSSSSAEAFSFSEQSTRVSLVEAIDSAVGVFLLSEFAVEEFNDSREDVLIPEVEVPKDSEELATELTVE